MTEEIIVDVSNCPHKCDDDCMEVPVCNEYGDLIGYQSCEAQTLCPYRSQKKIERLEQENKEIYENGQIEITKLCNEKTKYRSALEEIREIAQHCIKLKEKAPMKLIAKNNKLRSALEEIREIAQHCIRQDVCALCDYSKECAVPADGLVYDNNRLLIKLINEVLNVSF